MRYWWLRLQEKFFNQKPLRKLRRMAGGDTFTIIYLKMQLMSIATEGTIRYEGIEPTFGEELSLVLDESSENIQITLMFLEKYGLLEDLGNGLFLLPEAASNIGSEGGSAARMRRFREKKKVSELPLSHCDGIVTQMLCGSDTDNNTSQKNKTNNNNNRTDNGGGVTREIMTSMDESAVQQIIEYAQKNKLGPGWLLVAARDPAKRPPAEWEKKDIKPKDPDPDCPICHGLGGWGEEVKSTIGKKMKWKTCNCIYR